MSTLCSHNPDEPPERCKMKSYARYSCGNRDVLNVVWGIPMKILTVIYGIVLKGRWVTFGASLASWSLGLSFCGSLSWDFWYKSSTGRRWRWKVERERGQPPHVPSPLTLSFVSSSLAPLGYPFTNCEGAVLTLLYLCPSSPKNPLSDSNCPFVCDIFCRDLDWYRDQPSFLELLQ